MRKITLVLATLVVASFAAEAAKKVETVKVDTAKKVVVDTAKKDTAKKVVVDTAKKVEAKKDTAKKAK
jgi:hypothetical protein